MDIEILVKKALNGDKTALEGMIGAIQDDIFYLSLRMLANHEAARDASQDILIKIITNLSSFRFDSKFKTWAYRVASNYLISEKKVLDRNHGLTFDIYKMDLESDLQEPDDLKNNPDYQLVLNELRISCTMAMLLCLNPQHRIAYILGDILELDHNQASSVLDISKDSFRKQLSRARNKVMAFTSESCSLVNTCAKCSCDKKLTGAINRKRINPRSLHFSDAREVSYNEIKATLLQTQQELKAITLQKSIAHAKSPHELSEIIGLIVNGQLNGGHV